MMKQYLGHVLASSLLLAGAAKVYAADTAADTTKVKIQRSFVNLSFNNPKLTSAYKQHPEADVEGWKTTHPNPKLIEVWRGSGANDTQAWRDANGGAYSSTTANQYAELNASAKSALYQNVCLFKDEEFAWNFRHAARSSTKEQTTFYIGKVSTDRFSFTKDQTIGTSQAVTELFQWKDANPNGTKAKVNVASGIYQFIFDATAFGTDATLGNFIDDITLNLRPAVEFSAASGSFYEGGSGAAGKEYSVPFNIVGQIASQSALPTLQFKIEYLSGYAQTKAVYGTNYRLYKRVGGNLVELTSASDSLNISNPDKVTFNYTPVYNSSLDYSKGVQVNDLVIKIFGNTQTNADITLPFSFALDANSGAIATSLSACGNVTADVNFDLKIQEDDVDLSVVKSLTAESVVLKDNLVSYTLDVVNNTNVQADGVVLRDDFKNLLRVTGQTALVCEDLTSGTSKACPAAWTDSNALTSLFTTTVGSGLSLGNIPANAKYRFTVKNLKVTDTDTANTGYVVNTATIETTKMNDLAPGNDTSTVKTLMAAKNDLSNNKAGAPVTETGVGLFYSSKEGRTGVTPLLTNNVDSSNKTYFPLNIQNYSGLAQDYQLYASSTAIVPTQSTGDYSTLLKTGITPFTSGLKVEFYKADIGQCKAGISSQQITQLNIAANTTGQVCAVITAYSSVVAKTNIWFAIESLQSGLGDIILDAIIPQPQKRLLELSNDQTAQVGVGGSYVFLHRLTNYGVENETKVKVGLSSTNNNGFLYTLFLDQNGNSILDASDTLLSAAETELSNIIEPNKSVTLFIKVEAPATATNGMTSQVRLIAKPDNTGKAVTLADLSNTDLITVSPSQLQILKSQFKVASCSMANAQAVINSTYTVQNESLKPSQCLIYRIMVKNSGSETLNNVIINDMYPAYTKQWASTNILPIVGSNGQNITDSSNNKIEDDQVAKIRAILKELLPQQEKSLYFGIKMN
ncbi:DUF11 domain-containing protein [Acinetobacter sp. ANC 4177]|uniref:DUF11 domain-containing protein n=1 Tax=Acinetobacter sp. ANC 4177 TaxID=2529838 RepID=UPI00103B99F9|nr:DUF11 domain-containing protein [Acinetobacter sp. ANC 4177]TCB73103.1 hypothetical protein E0H91_13395 [Acinetobacter sp. ANC 4177]